ncbi:Nucleolar MIF4G domain-containing protein 1 [Paragonimus westermani]|uniref:Nucleolar MIF4G domain-containing protein 1 n=1 Tax=Paragonimus westermani TaxID=34504 RepID=A0A8T0DRK9_9TREM|nr:Nucleolar MIF4G domain-containing protein 1 [Paragonimus westermani]
MKMKNKRASYNDIRKTILLEDNEKEDKLIRRLEKRLKINKHTKGCTSNKKHPLWLRQYGLDYILDFEKEICLPKHENSKLLKPVGVLSGKKTIVDLYGQGASETNNGRINTTSVTKDHPALASSMNESDKPMQNTDANNPSEKNPVGLHRTVRSWLNRLSEEHMARVISALADLFGEYPRASVRSVIIEEVCTLLESTVVHSHSSIGWLQQDLAVCIACVHATLHAKLQHDNLVGYATETLVEKMFPSEDVSTSADAKTSVGLFISYLFRFGVLSSSLIFDIISELIQDGTLSSTKAAHFMCAAVGVNLRKSNAMRCQELIDLSTKLMTSCSKEQVDLTCELEGIVQRLSEKYSKEECVARALHLKKLMRSWTKGITMSKDLCLSVGLSDLRSTDSKGRWWLVGSATQQSASVGPPTTPRKAQDIPSLNPVRLTPEIEQAANVLGLRTQTRRQLFNILVSTSGGPDATASALLRACPSGNVSREREVIQIVTHCLMSEEPFNRFYPRVLGGFLNTHRRFLMMIKCAIWDVLKKTDLSVNAKAHAGRAVGILASVYDLPLTVLKNFNFADASEANTSFLRSVFIELCTGGEYQKMLTKVMQLSCYTRLSRNCRIFLRKHFATESDENVRTIVLRLANDMRENEFT